MLQAPPCPLGFTLFNFMPYLSQLADGTVQLRLHVQPKASKTRIAGIFDGCLKLTVLAPPVDGRANDVVVQYVASLLAIPGRDVVLKSGAQGRRKMLVIHGLTEDEVRQKIASQFSALK